MIKMILAFILFSLVFYFGIEYFRKLTKKEKWTLTKNLGYAILCSVLAIIFLSLIVFLF